MIITQIKKIREEKGLTAEHVADKALVSAKTVYNAERGRSVNISTAKRLAKAIGVTLDELRGEGVV